MTRHIVPIITLLLALACQTAVQRQSPDDTGSPGSDGDSDHDDDSDADSDSDGDADSDSDSDSDGDTDADVSSEGNSDADSDSEADAKGETDADVETDIGTDSDADSDTDADNDSVADADSNTNADTNSDSDADNDSNPPVEVDPDVTTRISGFIDSLPWGPSNIDGSGLRDELIDAINKTCIEFAPPGDNWQYWCEAFLVASACKESSLDVKALVEDSYGGTTDPTVGLLQNRFSSTVQDYNAIGPKDSLERIGCDWPDFSGISDWRQEGAPTWVDWMQDVHCNIAIGAWYYLIHATGDATWTRGYCNGEAPSGGILVVGMLSHLKGPNNVDLTRAHSNPYDYGDDGGYVQQIKDWFDNMISPTPDPHPLIRELAPYPEQYCE